MNRENLEFASLLHDIGKFAYRTGNKHSTDYDNLTQDDFGENGAHGKWSAEFLKNYFNSIIADITLYHHNPKKSEYDFAQIVQNADHHSSSERIEDKKSGVFTTPLQSICSDIIIKDNKETKELYVPLRKIDLNYNFENIIPKSKEDVLYEKSLKSLYNDLWNNFEEEVKALKNPSADFNTILALLRKYTSNMPSATWGQNQIFLYMTILKQLLL